VTNGGGFEKHIPQRSYRAEALWQGLECLMAGTEATSPSSKLSHPAGPAGAAGCQRLPIESKAQLCMGLIWQPANLSPGS